MAAIFAFGPFRLDSDSEMLFRDNEPVTLGRRAVALLRMLLESPGTPVLKNDLIDRAWPGISVEENNLTVQIGALRRILADAGGATWIETIPRRGYRFVGPVVAKEGKTEAAGLQRFAQSNITTRLPTHFLGRDEALAEIEQVLTRNNGRVAITALHGLRGVGKTTLAAAYAERHRGDYRATWWIRAQTEPTMRADLVALGVRLGWVGADDKEEPALAAVMERLPHEGEGILLIFDNALDADALKPYLPRGGAARVLVTSNAHDLARGRGTGRNPPLAQGDRRRLPDCTDRPRRGARRGRGFRY